MHFEEIVFFSPPFENRTKHVYRM